MKKSFTENWFSDMTEKLTAEVKSKHRWLKLSWDTAQILCGENEKQFTKKNTDQNAFCSVALVKKTAMKHAIAQMEQLDDTNDLESMQVLDTAPEYLKVFTDDTEDYIFVEIVGIEQGQFSLFALFMTSYRSNLDTEMELGVDEEDANMRIITNFDCNRIFHSTEGKWYDLPEYEHGLKIALAEVAFFFEFKLNRRGMKKETTELTSDEIKKYMGKNNATLIAATKEVCQKKSGKRKFTQKDAKEALADGVTHRFQGKSTIIIRCNIYLVRPSSTLF